MEMKKGTMDFRTHLVKHERPLAVFGGAVAVQEPIAEGHGAHYVPVHRGHLLQPARQRFDDVNQGYTGNVRLFNPHMSARAVCQ